MNDLNGLKEHGLDLDYDVSDEDLAVWAAHVAETLMRLMLRPRLPEVARPDPPRNPDHIEHDGDDFWDKVEANTRERLGL